MFAWCAMNEREKNKECNVRGTKNKKKKYAADVARGDSGYRGRWLILLRDSHVKFLRLVGNIPRVHD